MERVTFECANCGHEWKGLPPSERASRGNPPCSECGRRTGQVVEEIEAIEVPTEPLDLEDGPDPRVFRCGECGVEIEFLDRECPNGHKLVGAWTAGTPNAVDVDRD